MRKKSEKKLQQLLLHDITFLEQGYESLAGVDEAGRGPWAGPVVASAVVVRDASFLSDINDSKKMTPRSRDEAYAEILAKCDVGVGIVDAASIDRWNILQATFRAMEDAVSKLGVQPSCVLIDGDKIPRLEARQFPIVGGDRKSLAIACASIVAKVTRDRMMDDYDKTYPVYGFKNHKGYGTSEHARALSDHGPCNIHRKSFAPIRNGINKSNLMRLG